MKAEYTIKVGDRYIRAGEEIPGIEPEKEESPKVEKVEVVEKAAEPVKPEKKAEPKPRRTASRKKG